MIVLNFLVAILKYPYVNVFQNESKVEELALLFKMSFVRFYGILGFPDVSIVNNLPANAGDAGDMGLIPGSGIPSGGGNYNPLQYFFSENLTGRQQSQCSSVQLLHRVRLFVTP